jgi:hypothetical protein
MLSQEACRDVALDVGITHIVNLPWAYSSRESAFASVFYYYNGVTHLQSYTRSQRMGHWKYLVNWLNNTCRDVNNRVLLCDDGNGRTAASLCAVYFLMSKRHMSYKGALYVVKSAIRGRIKVQPKFLRELKLSMQYGIPFTNRAQIATIDTDSDESTESEEEEEQEEVEKLN